MSSRTATLQRRTRETDITLTLDIDGAGRMYRPESASSTTC